jgi:hypothetical protein
MGWPVSWESVYLFNPLEWLIDEINALIHAQHNQFTASSLKLKLSTHCIAMATMVAYRAQILNFLQRHPGISILNDIHNKFLWLGRVQINRAFEQFIRMMVQSKPIPVPVKIAQSILLTVAHKIVWRKLAIGVGAAPEQDRIIVEVEVDDVKEEGNEGEVRVANADMKGSVTVECCEIVVAQGTGENKHEYGLKMPGHMLQCSL